MKRSTLLTLLLLLCVSGIFSTTFAQGNFYVKEDFERYGWWLGGSGNWTTGWAKAPYSPAAVDTGYTWGPNRARWYRENSSDPTLFSAYGTRRNQFNPVTPSNYESTYVAGIHSIMETEFLYKPTTNPLYFGFKYFVNLHTSLVNGADSFYVVYKLKTAPDVPASWKPIFSYGKPLAGDTLSGTEKWFDFSKRMDPGFNYVTDQTIVLRFGFFSKQTPPGAGPTTATKAWGAWVDNVSFYEEVKYDLFVNKIELKTIIDATINDPAYCEQLKPWVNAGCVDPQAYPDSFKFTFYRWKPTPAPGSWEVLSSGVRKQTSATDVNWNPMAGVGNGLVSFLQGETKFKLELAPYFTGTSEKSKTNNSVEKTYAIKLAYYQTDVDEVNNAKYYPESASKKLAKVNPAITGVKAFWLEKFYGLENAQGTTPVMVNVFKENGFDLPVYVDYAIDNAWNITGSNNNLTQVTAAALTNLKANIVAAPGYGFPGNQTNGFKFDAAQNKAYFNVIAGDKVPSNIPTVLKLKFNVNYKNRYDGTPVCITSFDAYAIIPRDYQIIPVEDSITVAPPVNKMIHTFNVWRFNKHNKNVVMRFYTTELADSIGNLNATYTAALTENKPAPIAQERPRKTLSVDTVTFDRTVNSYSPSNPLAFYNRVVMYGYDGNILADTVYHFRIRRAEPPPPSDFTLTTNTPVTQTVKKPGCVVYSYTIGRSNYTGAVNFDIAKIVAAPSNGSLTYGFSASSGGPFTNTVAITANTVYLQVCAVAATPSQNYVVTITGEAPSTVSKTRTAACTLAVTSDWRAAFKIREWNTFNPEKTFYFGMNAKSNKGLDPANVWADNNEALVSLPTDPYLFSYQFKLDTTVASYSVNEYRPVNEDPNTTITYYPVISGRWPFIITYDPRQSELKNREIKVVDKITGGNIYSTSIQYNANKTADTLPFINDFALNGFWYLEFRVKYKPTASSATSVEENTVIAPATFTLDQNYPNPFNPSTVITYSIPKDEYVKLEVVNAIGEVVATLVDGMQKQGKNAAIFNAKNLPSGIYLYKIQAGSFTDTKKMLLVK